MLGSCVDIPELLASCMNPWMVGLDFVLPQEVKT